MRWAIAAAVVLGLLAGCGSQGSEEALTDEERSVVVAFRSSAALVGAGQEASEAPADFEAMVALTREKPDAESGIEGLTVREVLARAPTEFDLGPDVQAYVGDVLGALP